MAAKRCLGLARYSLVAAGRVRGENQVFRATWVCLAAMGKPLIIFEMANNHMGDIAHGAAVIRAFANVANPFRDTFRFAFKLQYRDLDSFIHPAFRGRDDVKYVRRFEATRVNLDGVALGAIT